MAVVIHVLQERRLAAEARRKQELEAQEKKSKAKDEKKDVLKEDKKKDIAREEKEKKNEEGRKEEAKVAEGKLYQHIERLMATPVSSPNRTFVVK